MAQRAVLWSGVLLAGALFAASATWSYALQPCTDLPAAQRERARRAARCEGPAPIVELSRRSSGKAVATAPRVPDLRDRPFQEDDERLARYLVALDYRESAKRRDWVIDQVPRPPATLPDGGSLRLVLSDGTLVQVPDVRGDFARALMLLHRAGLTWSTGRGPVDRVIGQSPAAGTAVRPGTSIALQLAPGRLALAPESTRRDITPGAAPAPTAPATAPTPPAGTTPPAATPRASQATPPRAAPATTTMPDVQGMRFEAARERLAGLDVQRVQRGGTEPAGTVIGQTPAAGAALAPGASVRLVLSDGALVRVPRLASFTLNEARQRAANGDLRAVVSNVPSDAPTGTVVSQQPAEGQIARRGTAVRLNVSSGPAAPPVLAVPNVIGLPYERARPQLERFRVERTERAAREAAGTVLEQDPAAGARAQAGSTVSIIVSSGGRPEAIEVANVVGQDVDGGVGALSEFRLEREVVPGVAPAGRVLAQDPAPGATAAPGSTVRLRVSDGSRVRTPNLADMPLAQARDAARAAGLAVAVSEGADDPQAAVLRQAPAAGSEIARGATVQLAVQERTLPFALDVPPAVRDAWMRVAAYGAEVPARTLAIAIVLLFALLALLAVARRRRSASYVVVEPHIHTREPPPPVRAVAGSAPAPAPTPTPPPAAAAEAAPPTSTWTPVPRVLPKVFGRRSAPPAAAVTKAPTPEAADVSAVARLESDAARTIAPTAAPRGPEIRIAARLEAGEGRVRDLPPEPARDELTEETK